MSRSLFAFCGGEHSLFFCYFYLHVLTVLLTIVALWFVSLNIPDGLVLSLQEPAHDPMTGFYCEFKFFICSLKPNNRIILAIWLRDFPTKVAISSW